jgi:hypothetical protein
MKAYKEKERSRIMVRFFLYGIPLFIVLYIVTSSLFSSPHVYYSQETSASSSPNSPREEPVSSLSIATSSSQVAHIKTPQYVKGIYMSSWVAGTPSVRARIEDLLDTTELNTVLIDVKDSSGVITFEIEDKELAKISVVETRIKDVYELIDTLHKKNVYIIARVAVFQDPGQVKLHPEDAVKSKKTGGAWKDRSGLAWIDPGSKRQWEYTARVAEYAYSIGFDEIGFDYIRFPSDGALSDMVFPYSEGKNKEAVVSEFFAYMGARMKEKGIPSSADIFGLTTMNNDDLGIGQKLEPALQAFDYVSPMTYPSHYAMNAFRDFTNPNAHPYETIKLSYEAALRKIDILAKKESTTQEVIGTSTKMVLNEVLYADKKVLYKNKLRPFLQDFSLGQPPYGVREVRAQIKALEDLGIYSYLLWDAKNKYTKGAFAAE